MDSKMASNPIHDNCIQTDDKTQTYLEIELSNTTSDDLKAIPLKNIESNVEKSVETAVETTAEPKPLMNGENSAETGDQLVSKSAEEVIESDEKSIIGTNGEPNIDSDSVTQTEAKPESSGFSKASKYIRKTPTDLLLKIWDIVDSEEWLQNGDELNKSLLKKMFNSFNIKFNENRMKQLIDGLIADKLLAAEQKDNKIRYVLNFDRQLFGELTNDWFCFECHSVRDGDQLIGCKKCFKSFHSQCLKGDHKVANLKEESFECHYCRRSAEADPNGKVDRLTKGELNKCISFVVNNLQLSYESQMFDIYAIEDSAQNKVIAFKPMDVMTIRHKALTEQYNTLEEAVTDFKHFIHNFNLCKREEATALREFERRFGHEIKELKLCVDCYKYSSDIAYDIEGDPHDWFTLVCDPPHELVFAKYGKYPFWPAKVIEIKAGGKQYDVRFFDAPEFSRAVVPTQRLRPIENFEFEDEDNDLELPIQLMEKHINKMRAKGVYFMPTIVRPQKKLPQKRPNTDPKGTDRPNKRPKKKTDN